MKGLFDGLPTPGSDGPYAERPAAWRHMGGEGQAVPPAPAARPAGERLFDGATIDDERDNGRLFAQLERVRSLMADGGWRTLAAIADAVGDPQASVSARLRDLRKPRWGSMVVERRYQGNGLFEYRLVSEAEGKGGASCQR